MSTLLSAILLLSSAAPVTEPQPVILSPTPVQTPIERPVEPKKQKPKKICRVDDNATGTRISHRVCKTQAEWDAKEDGQEIASRSKTSRADLDNVGVPTGRAPAIP